MASWWRGSVRPDEISFPHVVALITEGHQRDFWVCHGLVRHRLAPLQAVCGRVPTGYCSMISVDQQADVVNKSRDDDFTFFKRCFGRVADNTVGAFEHLELLGLGERAFEVIHLARAWASCPARSSTWDRSVRCLSPASALLMSTKLRIEVQRHRGFGLIGVPHRVIQYFRGCRAGSHTSAMTIQSYLRCPACARRRLLKTPDHGQTR